LAGLAKLRYTCGAGYDKDLREYSLGFPNEEVQYGFLNNLYKYLFPENNSVNDLNVRTFFKALRLQSGNFVSGEPGRPGYFLDRIPEDF
jgi:hypothetical protein